MLRNWVPAWRAVPNQGRRMPVLRGYLWPTDEGSHIKLREVKGYVYDPFAPLLRLPVPKSLAPAAFEARAPPQKRKLTQSSFTRLWKKQQNARPSIAFPSSRMPQNKKSLHVSKSCVILTGCLGENEEQCEFNHTAPVANANAHILGVTG
eukprot:EG_transcript_14337